MSDQIIDIVDVGIPGVTGDVTPEALEAAGRAEAAASESEQWRDQSETFANSIVAFQDSAVAGFANDPASQMTEALGASVVSKLHGVKL